VATVANHFDWVHSSSYNDQYKAVQPKYSDVVLDQTPYSRQIETALEESVIGNAGTAFAPDADATREWAAGVYAKAFGITTTQADALSIFSDAAQIGEEYRASVNALVGAGYMQGTSATAFSPKAQITVAEAEAVLKAITGRLTSPPQVMCKSGTTAPRRFIRISTPTAGAAIYYTVTTDGSEPADPLSSGRLYDFYAQGVLQYASNGTVRLKAVAVRDDLEPSVVREFFWKTGVPDTAEYQATVYHEASGAKPKVWKIFNKAENLGPFVYYIEGSTRGLVFDCGQISPDKANLKSFVDSIATKPYDMIVGHNHSDHSSQIYNFTSAGIPFYCSGIEKAAFMADSNANRRAAGTAAIAVPDGHTFDLGSSKVSIFIIPGHTNGTVTAVVHEAGWVFGSDMWGCNRPTTADTTQYSSVKVDLFLSLTLQLLADYRKRIVDGQIVEVTNAHQEVPVGMACVDNFVQCFQQLIDEGDAASKPSIRGGIANRMSIVGDMWRDKNWMAIGPIGSGYGKPVDYLSKPTVDYPNGIGIDYNVDNGYRKYATLSNVEFEQATLVGVNVYWAAPANGTPNMLPNKFDPWTFDYRLKVPAGQRSVAIRPRAMSNKASGLKVNGAAVAQSSRTVVPVSAGSRIVVEVTSPDGSATNRYSFTVEVA